jgi:hypothetical protein
MGHLTKSDTVELVSLAARVREIRPKLSYDIADPTSVDVIWVEGCANGVLGSYSWLRPREIRLAETFRPNPEMAVPTFVHELRHVYQHRTMHWALFALARIPVIRARILEPSAWQVERDAEKALGMDGFNDGKIPWF